MLLVTYNHPGLFGAGWCSGNENFKDWSAFNQWLLDRLVDGPVLITSIQELK